ncbi:hypothetical protein Q31b_25490 [Novipirellula aureliae]|uniref:Uncharacterized protein n=1 Tax=Novipirellula aureliae TaxID=2527966 RepID=A0A5C6E3P2_9BACT|nr:hypothetical protein Q31b_25490 [Novipirellula aureliae]
MVALAHPGLGTPWAGHILGLGTPFAGALSRLKIRVVVVDETLTHHEVGYSLFEPLFRTFLHLEQSHE